jgi:hypothetical protein
VAAGDRSLARLGSRSEILARPFRARGGLMRI